MWIQTGVTVWKRLSWVVTSVTLTFDLWPRSFAWTSLLPLVITPDNFMMIRWWEHSQKGVTDGRTDGQTDRRIEPFRRAAWSQLKKFHPIFYWACDYLSMLGLKLIYDICISDFGDQWSLVANQLDPKEETAVKFEPKFKDFHLRNFIWKCHLQNVIHFVSESTQLNTDYPPVWLVWRDHWFQSCWDCRGPGDWASYEGRNSLNLKCY